MALTLTEKWDMDMLMKLVNEGPRAEPALMAVLQAVNQQTGELRATYKAAEGAEFGRVYAYPSLQSVPGWARRLCAHDTYHDIDISNCFPSLLLQVAQQQGLECPPLKRYVEHRDAVFRQVQAEWGTGRRPPLSREVLKRCFLVSLHNGDYRRNCTKGSSLPTLDAFHAALRALGTQLVRKAALADLVARLRQREDKPNKEGTFISWVCQRVENTIIQELKAFFESVGRTVGVLVFDGLMLEREGPGELPQELLRRAERYIKERTGYAVLLAEKSMKPTDTDLAAVDQKNEAGEEDDEELPDVVPDAVPVDQKEAAEEADDEELPEAVPEEEKGRFEDAIVLHDHHVRDIHFGLGTRAVLINASMGLGKSTAAKKYIQRIRPQRVLVITARRQQAHSALGLLSDLGFVHYRDVRGSLSSEDRLIVQYESLHRLVSDDNGRLRPYNLVVVDEIRSVAGQVCSSTNKEFLSVNAKIFKALSQNSRSLWMDADLEVDRMVKMVAHEMWPREHQRTVYRYTHVALRRTLCIQTTSSWTQRLCSQLQQGKRVMAVFRTKRDMQVALGRVTKTVPRLPFLAFSSDSTEEDMKAFQKINEEVGKVQLLCFTSKVTVGADIQTYIDEVFVHAGATGGCTARDMFQMTGRARNVRNPCIQVLLPTPRRRDDVAASYDGKLRELLQNRQLRERYVRQVTQGELELIDGQFRWTSDWVTKVLACTLAEQDTDFHEAFVRLTRQKQYRVVPAEAEVGAEAEAKFKEETKEIQGEIKKAEKEEERKQLEAIQREKPIINRELHELGCRIAKGEATVTEKVRHRLLAVCMQFLDHYPEMTLDQVRLAWKRMPALLKLKRGSQQPTQDLRHRDLKRLGRAPLPELAKMRDGQLHETNLAAKAAGFQSAFDTTTEIKGEAFSGEQGQAILRHADKAAALENRRTRTRTEDPELRSRNALRRELRAVGMQLTKKRQRQPGRGRVEHFCIQMDPRLAELLPLMRAEPGPIAFLADGPAAQPPPRVAEAQADPDAEPVQKKRRCT